MVQPVTDPAGAQAECYVPRHAKIGIIIMKIAAAQIVCALGDLEANLCTIHDFASRAKDDGAELVVFPEMVDTGYSMPVIQKHATGGNEGAVPQLQKMTQ